MDKAAGIVTHLVTETTGISNCLHSRPFVNMKGTLYFGLYAILITSCICAATTGRDRPSQHKETLSEKDHSIDGEHNDEYDHEAFLGDMKDEYDELTPEEAKKRLKVLVRRVDTDSDGFVTEAELTNWIKEMFNKRLEEGVEEDVKTKDEDKDGKITWDEYKKSTYGAEELDGGEADEESKKMLFVDKRRFDTADKDKDGGLTKMEYVRFMHPESSPDMEDVQVAETIEDIDLNKDGFVSLDEFLGDYKDADDAEADEPEWVTEERKKFKEAYDKDNDGKLNKEEVKLWVLPETEFAMAQEEAKHLVTSADENKDGKLSEEEIVNNHETFVGSEATDYGRALPKHEEL